MCCAPIEETRASTCLFCPSIRIGSIALYCGVPSSRLSSTLPLLIKRIPGKCHAGCPQFHHRDIPCPVQQTARRPATHQPSAPRELATTTQLVPGLSGADLKSGINHTARTVN
ncbi:hypothetical protein E2C01_013963 [Portunus trituberculatus]|uniref:Uncharacterized protein n=1 Tax=Portunus trituberculatus TaxID=210409 RepID=A0A5B7DHL2_PORTR|nr:hypothetical protein [Portunus trituberculatus]